MRGRNPVHDSQIQAEDFRLIAAKPHIMWVFYHGYVSRTEIATGYNPAQHEGWCIPLLHWRRKEKMPAKQWISEAMDSARKLRIVDTGVILQNYSDPETNKWWIVAPVPEANPVFGVPVRAQPSNREALLAVPQGSDDPGGDMERRVAALRGDNEKAKDYPGVDEVWVATLRIQPDGHVKVYPQGIDEGVPLLTLYRQLTNIKSQSTKFDHDPDQTIFGQYQVSPASKDIPSTNTIPVRTFIPFSPDFLMVTAMALATAKYINKAANKKQNNRNKNEETIVPTVFIDYDELRRE